MTHSTIQITQGVDVLVPKTGKAYMIPCDEWDVLRERLGRLSTEPWFFHTVGSLLLGGGLSTLTSILVGSFSDTAQVRTLTIAWAATITMSTCGILCLVFAKKEREAQRISARDIVTQMALIEKRFERGNA